MNRLYIVRHGIALPHGTPGMDDDDRPLTSKGEERTRKVAIGLKRLGIAPSALLTSPLPRASKTAEIVAHALGLSDRVEHCDELRADRSAKSIRDWLNTREDEAPLIVGHNPAFTDLAALLLGAKAPAPFEMKRAGVAAFAVLDGHFRLEWFAPPALLRRIAR